MAKVHRAVLRLPALAGPEVRNPPYQPFRQQGSSNWGFESFHQKIVGGNFPGFALSFLRLLSFRCKASGCLFEKQKEGKKERKRGVSLGSGNSIKREPAPFSRALRRNRSPVLDTWDSPGLRRRKALGWGLARGTGCHATAPELPVPPDFLGGQQCQLSLGLSRVSFPLSVLCARKARAKEATATTTTSEEEEGPQHRPVSPRDVFHGSGGPAWIGDGTISALPSAEGTGRTQRGKQPRELLCPEGTGVRQPCCSGGRKVTGIHMDHSLACKVLGNPFLLS